MAENINIPIEGVVVDDNLNFTFDPNNPLNLQYRKTKKNASGFEKASDDIWNNLVYKTKHNIPTQDELDKMSYTGAFSTMRDFYDKGILGRKEIGPHSLEFMWDGNSFNVEYGSEKDLRTGVTKGDELLNFEEHIFNNLKSLEQVNDYIKSFKPNNNSASFINREDNNYEGTLNEKLGELINNRKIARFPNLQSAKDYTKTDDYRNGDIFNMTYLNEKGNVQEFLKHESFNVPPNSINGNHYLDKYPTYPTVNLNHFKALAMQDTYRKRIEADYTDPDMRLLDDMMTYDAFNDLLGMDAVNEDNSQEAANMRYYNNLEWYEENILPEINQLFESGPDIKRVNSEDEALLYNKFNTWDRKLQYYDSESNNIIELNNPNYDPELSKFNHPVVQSSFMSSPKDSPIQIGMTDVGENYNNPTGGTADGILNSGKYYASGGTESVPIFFLAFTALSNVARQTFKRSIAAPIKTLTTRHVSPLINRGALWESTGVGYKTNLAGNLMGNPTNLGYLRHSIAQGLSAEIAGIPGATLGNFANAGFGVHGMSQLYNPISNESPLYNSWANAETFDDYLNAAGHTGITGLELWGGGVFNFKNYPTFLNKYQSDYLKGLTNDYSSRFSLRSGLYPADHIIDMHYTGGGHSASIDSWKDKFIYLTESAGFWGKHYIKDLGAGIHGRHNGFGLFVSQGPTNKPMIHFKNQKELNAFKLELDSYLTQNKERFKYLSNSTIRNKTQYEITNDHMYDSWKLTGRNLVNLNHTNAAPHKMDDLVARAELEMNNFILNNKITNTYSQNAKIPLVRTYSQEYVTSMRDAGVKVFNHDDLVNSFKNGSIIETSKVQSFSFGEMQGRLLQGPGSYRRGSRLIFPNHSGNNLFAQQYSSKQMSTSNELEILLARGTKFKVTDIRRNDASYFGKSGVGGNTVARGTQSLRTHGPTYDYYLTEVPLTSSEIANLKLIPHGSASKNASELLKIDISKYTPFRGKFDMNPSYDLIHPLTGKPNLNSESYKKFLTEREKFWNEKKNLFENLD